MLGTNPKRPPSKGDGSKLDIQTIFRTLQGEGPHVGTPSIFIRLGGCNLACKFCDTEFESYNEMSLDSIIFQVTNLSNDVIKLIVITGGEPLRQPITLLCETLLRLGYMIQIETNGTLYRELPKEVEIICSPKLIGGKYLKIHQELISRINGLKFLISKTIEGYSSVPELGQSQYHIPVYVQAIDQYIKEYNQDNQKLAVELALKYNYRLSYQTHKALGIE